MAAVSVRRRCLVNKSHHLALPLAYNLRPLQRPPQRMPTEARVHLGDNANYQRIKRESGLSREARRAREKDMVKKAWKRGVALIMKPSASKSAAASGSAKGVKRKPAAAASADGGKGKRAAAAAAGGKASAASVSSSAASAAPAAASPPRERAAAVSAAAPVSAAAAVSDAAAVSAAAAVSSRGRPLIEKKRFVLLEGDD